jgi:DNA-binding IscR family transcriptional regulator
VRADNSRHLVAAARQRSAATRERAVRALRHLDTTGRPVTVDAVARHAGVSRSWLYRQPDLLADIDRLRVRTGSSKGIPVRQRASDASVRQRLRTAHERIRILTAENRQLRDQLAAVLGELRSSRSS